MGARRRQWRRADGRPHRRARKRNMPAAPGRADMRWGPGRVGDRLALMSMRGSDASLEGVRQCAGLGIDASLDSGLGLAAWHGLTWSLDSWSGMDVNARVLALTWHWPGRHSGLGLAGLVGTVSVWTLIIAVLHSHRFPNPRAGASEPDPTVGRDRGRYA